MNRRPICILVLVVLLITALGPIGGSLKGAAGRANFSTNTTFDDNNTTVQKDFYSNGTDSTTSVSVPASAIILGASVNISGGFLEKEERLDNDTTADFLGGDLQNVSARNGSLILRPLLAQTTYNTSSIPLGIATGDLNLDGHIDIAVSDSGGNLVGVLPQNLFTLRLDPQVNYGVDPSPQGLAVGDINFDGRQDIAVACSGRGTLNVLLQAQDGTMGAAVSYQSGAGACSVAIGEFNRDAMKDLVVVNTGDSTISLFIQNPNGTLSRRSVISTGAGPSWVAAGDINLDGKDEAVVACKNSSTVVVFEQNATTGLKQNSSYSTGAGPVGVAIGDVNRDGRMDVVVAQQGAGSIGVMLQTSGGILGQRTDYPTAGAPSSVAIGDLNYDGRVDVAAGSGAQNISVFWQRSDGTLSPYEDFRAGNGPAGVAVADLNYDGKNDLAVANSADNTVGILPTRPIPPGIPGQMATYAQGGSPVGLKGGDLNADGLDDLAVAGTSVAPATAANIGLGVFAQTQAGVMANQVMYSTGSAPQGLKGVTIYDLNRDGRMDVVGTNMDTGGFFIFYQTTSGDFTGTPVAYTMNVSSGGYQVACGDLNSDGWPDIAISSIYAMPSGTEPYLVSVFMQDFANKTFIHTWDYYCEYARGVGIGDITSDGRDDLVMVTYMTSEIIVYTQNPNGTLKDTGVRYSTDSSPHGMRIGDLNGDGRNDVAVSAWTANILDVFIQNAGGTLNAKAGYPISNNAVDLEIADYDGDGLNDLVGSSYAGGAVLSLINQTREGKFSASTTIPTGAQPANLAKGDFNGDGRLDLAVANRGNGAAGSLGVFPQTVNVDMNGTYTSRFTQSPYKIVRATAFWNSTAAPQQTVSVWLSNDRGSNWTQATVGTPVEFASEGSMLGYRVRMNSSALNSTPSFNDITVHYTVRSLPMNPSLDIGATGTPVWKSTGAFGASGKPVTVDFTERLNEVLETSMPGPDGYFHVFFAVYSGSLGSLVLQDLLILYDIAPQAPVLLNLTDNGFITSQLPSFQMSAQDNDTRSLNFRVELSQNNFTTVKKSYDQTVSPLGWDKASYRPGETATFQLPAADRLTADGAYQWRALVWDGTVWSESSPLGKFRVDTKPPVAHVRPLPTFTNQTDFNLSWNGSDPEPGSGLAPEATFDILFKDRDNGQWQLWMEDTNETTAVFSGVTGKTYYFQARATDMAGNAAPTAPGNGDTKIIVDTSPATGTVRDDGTQSGDNTRLHATFTFNDPESSVVKYQYWVSTRPGETDTYTWGPEITDKRDVTVAGLFLMNGTRYFFGVRALNGAGIWSPATSSDGIDIKMKAPLASVFSPNGPQKDTDIQIQLLATDTNAVGITDGDLEYRQANVTTRATLDWSEWKEIGISDWGDMVNGSDPFIFPGEAGKAYRFRYRVRDRTGALSDFAEAANTTRINRPPKAVLTAPDNATVDEQVVFSANASSDPDGDKLVYTWDFGDGTTATGRSANHAFSKGKKYTVTLSVDDSIEKVSAETEISIKSLPSPPITVANIPWMYIAAAVAAAGVAAVLVMGTRKKRPSAPTEQRVRSVPRREAVPARPAPSPPRLDQSEAEDQVTAAMDAVAELKNKGLETSRADKLLGLATSAFADGRLENASMFSQKVLKIRDELVSAAAAAPAKTESAEDELKAAEAQAASLGSSGIDISHIETELDMARMFLADNDRAHALEHAKRASALALTIRENGQGVGKKGESPGELAPAAVVPKKVAVKKAVKASHSAAKAPVARAVKECSSCGMELEPDWKVCPDCEKPV